MPVKYIYRDVRAITLWLSACLLLVAAMILVGGYTRLSGSGLSITEWKPIHGIIPPLSAETWNEEFSAYKASPQYQKINAGMTLDEFKTIFWPEFLHRVLGRLIGMVFLIPLMVFWLRKSLSKPFATRLLIIFALGGMQGFIGWLMVKSGLVDAPYVSHFKLALHLAMALLVLALLLWALLDVSGDRKKNIAVYSLSVTCQLPPVTYLIWFTLLCLQILFGALVAGLHAGLVYNTWPMMNGNWLPDGGLMVPEPLHNPALVQFIHRKLAVVVSAGFIIWWYLCRAYVKNNRLGKVCGAIGAIIIIQFTLGVLTLLGQVPLPLALTHQMTAVLLFGLSVTLLYNLSSLRKQAWEKGNA